MRQLVTCVWGVSMLVFASCAGGCAASSVPTPEDALGRDLAVADLSATSHDFATVDLDACSVGETRCVGLVPQACSTMGTWESNTTCDFVCSAGACMGECVPGALSCDGLTPRSCDDTGTFVDGPTCPFVCSAGMCSGMCTPGETRCSDGTHAQTCDSTGTWQTMACAQICSAGTCGCSAGYTFNGTTCAPIDFCKPANGGCSPNAVCAQSGITPTCTCNASYSGDGLTCAAAPTNVVNEGFDDVTKLAGTGWIIQNSSSPLGDSSWYQGDADFFHAYDGATNAFIEADFSGTGEDGTLSNWLASPLITFGARASVSFYTRKVSPDDYADRIEVRLCTAAPCTPPTDTGVGSYTTLLTSVNPNLELGVYPTTWTQFANSNATGLPWSGQGRVAIRYFVTDSGLDGDNGDNIGVDRFVAAVSTPAYAVRGSVSGLTGNGLVLWLNGNVQLPVAATGAFDFGKHLDMGTPYVVTIYAQPTGQTCSVANGSGTIGSADVINVTASCTP